MKHTPLRGYARALAFVILCSLGQSTLAQAPGVELYSATVFEGTPGAAATARAQLEALRQVLIRVTGVEAAGRDEALITRIGDPAALLQGQKRDGAGNLTVTFVADALGERIRAGGYTLRPPSLPPAGPAAGTTRIALPGLRSLADYGRALRELQAIDAVNGMRVLRLKGNVLELDVGLRTDMASFLRSVRLQGVFQVDGESGGAGAAIAPLTLRLVGSS